MLLNLSFYGVSNAGLNNYIFNDTVCLERFAPYLKSPLTGTLNLMEVTLCAQRASFSTLPQEIECTSITGTRWTLAEIKHEKQQNQQLL